MLYKSDMTWSLLLTVLVLTSRAETVYAVDSCKAIFTSRVIKTEGTESLLAKQTASELVQRIRDDKFNQSVVDAYRTMSTKRVDSSKLTCKSIGQTIDDAATDLIFYLNPIELKQLANSQVYRDELISMLTSLSRDYISLNSKALRYAAEVVNAGLLLNGKKWSHFTLPEFSEIAKFENLRVERFPTLFRFDSRSPEEIKVAKGFFVIEKIPSLISEHTSPYSQGSGFVSTSSIEGNQFNLLLGPVLKNSRKINPTSQDIERLGGSMLNQSFKWAREIREIYEYRIKDVLGVKAAAGKAIEAESEVVVPFIAARQITQVRRVVYLIDVKTDGHRVTGLELKSSAWGDWVPL